jgi:hypothetical protein
MEAQQTVEERDADAEATQYVRSFVEGRLLARGQSVASILLEFHMVPDAWPPNAECPSVAELYFLC